MKKSFYLISVLFVFIACSSNEDKANKLIDDYMFKHLHDYKSYEAVETKIDTMYNSPITDKECIDLAKEINGHMEKQNKYDKDAEYDHNTMDIWSGGWSSSSNREYKKAYVSWCKNKKQSTLERIEALKGCKALIKRLEGLDGKSQIGWIADHTFRSNNLGGNSSISTYSFFIDKNFKEILYTMDDDDSEIYSDMPDIIGAALSLGTPEKVDSTIIGWQELIAKYDEGINKYQ